MSLGLACDFRLVTFDLTVLLSDPDLLLPMLWFDRIFGFSLIKLEQVYEDRETSGIDLLDSPLLGYLSPFIG